jgi:hypothetical protein
MGGTMTKVFLMLAAALSPLLLGCAGPSSTVAKPSIAGKSVVVASAVGDDLNLAFVGFMVFSNASSQQSVPEWGTDQRIIAAAVRLLKPSQASGISTAQGISKRSGEDLPDLLNVQTDYLLFFEPAATGDVLANTNQQIKGIGVFQHDTAMLKVFAHAALKVTLIDVRARQAVATSESLQSWPLRYGTQATIWPRKDYGRNGVVPINLKGSTKVSAEDLAKIQPDMNDRVEAAVADVLRKLELVTNAASAQQ